MIIVLVQLRFRLSTRHHEDRATVQTSSLPSLIKQKLSCVLCSRVCAHAGVRGSWFSTSLIARKGKSLLFGSCSKGTAFFLESIALGTMRQAPLVARGGRLGLLACTARRTTIGARSRGRPSMDVPTQLPSREGPPVWLALASSGVFFFT